MGTEGQDPQGDTAMHSSDCLSAQLMISLINVNMET